MRPCPRPPLPPPLMALAALVAGLVASRAAAHEPGTIQVAVVKATESGVANLLADPRGKGDAQVSFSFFNADPEKDVLLVFPPCAFDGEGQRRSKLYRVDSLRAALSGYGAQEAKADPQWSLCQASKSEYPGVFLLRRGQRLALKMALDFLPGAAVANPANDNDRTSRIAVRSPFDVFAVNPEDAGAVAQSLLDAKRPRAAQFTALLDRIGRGGPGDSRQWLTLFYEIVADTAGGSTGQYRRTTYEDLFLRFSLDSFGKEPGTTTGDEGAQLFALDDYRTPKRVPPKAALEYDPQHAFLYRLDTTSGGPEGGISCEYTRPDCEAFPENCMSKATSGAPAPVAAAAGTTDEGLAPTGAATYTITGQFSVKWTDHALHPGWGWVAVAYWNDSGNWVELASDWVFGDGRYTLTVNRAGYEGQNLRVVFRAYNRYYEPRTGSDDLFRWRNPDKTSISTSHDEGHRWADCDGGSANGIGEMYNGAYLMWSKLYWTGDINPLRANPLKVYFPNTTYDCGDGSGIPWSCANCGGSVWLTAGHGVQADVVQHEFAHQLHYEMWDNRFPSGACLSHSICTRYNSGLALTEGYADFLPAWVGCDRGDATCTASYGRDIEGSACVSSSQGNENEWNVAQAFHDLWDSHADGDDVLYYVDQGASQKLFFANGLTGGNCCGGGAGAVARGMTDYQSVYRSNCTPGHEVYIDRIFDQNVN